jgi:hypothetical protein
MTLMNRKLGFLFASTIAIAPSVTLAAPATTGRQPAPLSISPNHETGQPGASCEDLLNQPGQSISASGSAFNPDGTAGSVYAGNRDPINDKNTASVSQYDQACAVNQSPQH